LRRYLIAGLLLWLPLWVTFLVLKFLIGLLDQTILLLPEQYRPEQLIGIYIPGLGVLLSFIIIILTGVLVTNFLGRRLIHLWESMLARIPLVRTIYHSVKQVAETLFSTKEPAFRKVLLVEYPRKGMWGVAFQTGTGWQQARDIIGEELLTVFIPTTPNPTSGYLIVIPKKDTVELEVSVDQALRLVISLGVISPDKGGGGNGIAANNQLEE